MAKPFGQLAGNGMHVHCSLLDAAATMPLTTAAAGVMRCCDRPWPDAWQAWPTACCCSHPT